MKSKAIQALKALMETDDVVRKHLERIVEIERIESVEGKLLSDSRAPHIENLAVRLADLVRESKKAPKVTPEEREHAEAMADLCEGKE